MRRLALVLLAWGCAPKHLPPAEARPGVRFRVAVETRDGVPLDTHVLLPRGDGPFPTVFVRSPYPMGPVLDQRCARFNRHGYACAWQSVRGRNRSGGTWIPFEHEIDDAKDALAWLTAQPWVDGNIGLIGESYLGAVQWAAADDLPPEVKTFVPMMIGTDMTEIAYEGGLFRHEIATAWMSLMPDERFRTLAASRGYQRALATRPRSDMDRAAAGVDAPWFDEWVRADRPDASLWQRDIARRGMAAPANTTVPVLMLGGWADAFVGPQITSWTQLATRADSTLLIGPWEHLGRVATDVPQGKLNDDVGLGASYAQWARVLDWLDHHLKGRPLKYPVGKVLTWPVNGDGWMVRDAWPPPTTPRVWSLAPGADPQQCTGALGEGGLGDVAWTYDPEDPTPARGGAGLLAGSLPTWKGVTPGFVDQGRLCERRDDLLGFRSEPLTAPLHVAGPLKATLQFASDAPDTSVNVRFLEERPDGRRIHVREGIVALSFRDGRGDARYTPGEVVPVQIETWPVEYVFEAGSRVLVQVASASWPKYEAHANVVGHWADVTETRPARQRVVFQGSTVELPVTNP